MSRPPFTPEDDRQMAELGIAPEEAARQVELFRNPPPFTRVLRPCRPGDGIRRLSPGEEPALTARYREAAAVGEVRKFVPASGAATRMFKPLQSYLDRLEEAGGEPEPQPPEEVATFFANLRRFAFFEELAASLARSGQTLGPAALAGGPLQGEERHAVLRHLLSGQGIALAERPKGLIPFHRYPSGPRTAFEEHLVEAAAYGRDARGVCHVHFTVSPQHEAAFAELLEARRPFLEGHCAAHFEVSFSHQRRSTDTLAVDPDHRPFRLQDGSLLFRPGGHGALIENLGELAREGGALVLLKNIDNVLPESRQPPAVRWKELAGGCLLALRDQAFDYLGRLEAGEGPPRSLLEEAGRFLERELSRPLPRRCAAASPEELRRFLIDALDRPLRVAAVVRNLGEPGGGPFWVEAATGEVSPQIVETSQIHPHEPEQQAALDAATHFNPADIACALLDRHGRPYDLSRFIDPATVFIAPKSHEGRPLKALERPGLWNGAMAGWNTAFLEVPVATFAPVKTILDLLRPEHQEQQPA
ncbi:MAG TPA: DUF4301 family protein [Thermoanaerobaculia bacterium]|nr:DUF4301 family protein [Thermoanaerobaculia bacterium]